MNLGISSLIRLFDDILEHLNKHECIDFTKLTGEEITQKVIPYLKGVIVFIKNLNLEEIKKLRGYVGGSAVDKVLRHFQDSVNIEYEKFLPEGLSQWKKESCGGRRKVETAGGKKL